MDDAYGVRMMNKICFMVFVVFCSTAGAQSNAPMLDGFDAFSLMLEVTGNRDLRTRFAITDEMSKKIEQFLNDKDISRIGGDFLEIQRHGPSPSLPIEKLAKLDGELSERLRQAFPEVPIERIRAWAIKRLYRTPENAFLSPRVHKYLNLDPTTEERLKAAANAGKPEEVRMKMYEKRAKEIVMEFPTTQQILFARYAGCTLLEDFKDIAEKDGPLELECEEANSSSMLLYLRTDAGLQKRLRLSEEQINKIAEIHAQAVKQLVAVNANRMQEFGKIAKKEIVDTYAVLSEVQRRQLKQWIASLYFVVNPRRELSKSKVRDYLGLNDEKEWVEITRHIDELEKVLDLQIKQFDVAIVASFLDVMPTTKRGDASRLFSSVW